MFDNRLPSHQIESLMEGDIVLIEDWPQGWREPRYATAVVARTTATQIVVRRPTRRGDGTFVEERYRKKDAGIVGNAFGRAELVDPTNSRTSQGVTRYKRSRRQSVIDSLARQWERNRDDLDALRRLHAAIGEYLEDVDASDA